MLQQMRNPKVFKIGLWAILILTIPSFVALYGFSEMGQSGSGYDSRGRITWVTVEPPGGKRVNLTNEHVDRARNEIVREYSQFYREITGRPPDAAFSGMVEGGLRRKEMADYAVSQAALQDLGRDLDIVISNNQISDVLAREGVTQQRLQDILRANRMTENQYLDYLRGLLQQQRTEDVIRSVAKVSLLEMWLQYRLENDEVTVTYAKVPVDDLLDEIEVTEAEVRDFFEQHASEYTKPEERVYRYAVVSPPPFSAQLPVPDDELRARYEQIDHATDTRFQEPPGRQIRHIMMTVDEGETPESVQALLQELHGSLEPGTWADLANAHTEDLANLTFTGQGLPQQRGGLLAQRVHDDTAEMMKERYGETWLEVANRLEQGEMSDVFESDGKFFILRVEHISDGHMTFEEARSILLSMVRQEKQQAERTAREEFLREMQLKMREVAATRSSIEGIAAELGADVRETSPTVRTTVFFPGIGDLSRHMEVINEMGEGDISPVVKADGTDNLVVMELDRILPERPREFDEVRAQVERRLKTQKATQRAGEIARQLAERVRNGDQLTSAAAELNLEFAISQPFKVAEPPMDLRMAGGNLANFLFRSEPGAVEEIRSGFGEFVDYVVVQLNSKTEPDRRQFIEDMKALEVGLQQAKSQGILNEFRRDSLQWMNPSYNEEIITEDTRRGRRRRG